LLIVPISSEIINSQLYFLKNQVGEKYNEFLTSNNSFFGAFYFNNGKEALS